MRGRDLLRLMESHGWTLDRIRGSHHVMTKPGERSIPVPIHGNRDLPPGTARAILKQAGIEEEV